MLITMYSRYLTNEEFREFITKEWRLLMSENKEFLATEPVGKLLLKLAVPSVISQLVNMLYNIVDRIYIGHIPKPAVSLSRGSVSVCLLL